MEGWLKKEEEKAWRTRKLLIPSLYSSKKEVCIL
jgi:hypothetical protein